MSAFTSDGSSGAVRVVCQRVCGAELLLDGEDAWAKMAHGLIVYVSFTKDVTPEILPRVARAIAHFNVVTKGNWGDGTKPVSAHELVCQRKERCGVMVIPQAGLCAKIKSKALQYRGQCDKAVGMELYGMFCELLRREICSEGGGKSASSAKTAEAQAAGAVSPDVPPTEMFHGHPDFSAWDEETGLPTLMADGETAVSKSKRKKLAKLQKSHAKKHKAYLENPEQYRESIEAGQKAKQEAQVVHAAGGSSGGSGGGLQEEGMANSEHLPFIQGTFGNRQGLRVDASCGPFTHAFAFGGGN